MIVLHGSDLWNRTVSRDMLWVTLISILLQRLRLASIMVVLPSTRRICSWNARILESHPSSFYVHVKRGWFSVDFVLMPLQISSTAFSFETQARGLPCPLEVRWKLTATSSGIIEFSLLSPSPTAVILATYTEHSLGGNRWWLKWVWEMEALAPGHLESEPASGSILSPFVSHTLCSQRNFLNECEALSSDRRNGCPKVSQTTRNFRQKIDLSDFNLA